MSSVTALLYIFCSMFFILFFIFFPLCYSRSFESWSVRFEVVDYEDLGRRLFLFGFEGLLSESRLRCHEGYCICNGGSLHRHEGGGYWEMFTLYGKKGVYPNGSILHKVVMCHLQLNHIDAMCLKSEVISVIISTARSKPYQDT